MSRFVTKGALRATGRLLRKEEMRMKKLALTTACLALLTMAASGAWANPIPPQATLSAGSIGNVVFTNTGSSISFDFTGTVGTCGHANCTSGLALLAPQSITGQYWMWVTGGTATLSQVTPGCYDVNMNGSVIHLEVQLGTAGSMGTLMTAVTLAGVYGTNGSVPTFDGTFATSMAIKSFLPDFTATDTGIIDYTVRMPNKPWISVLPAGHTNSGYVSSGEVIPGVPEPSSLALLGTGVLGLAGATRRKSNK